MKFVKLNITKKALMAFCTVFGDISVPIYNNTGEITDTEVIPIIWASRNKTYEILNSKYLKTDLNPDNQIELAQKLPILSISDLSFSTDSSRTRNKTHRLSALGNDSFMPAPILLNFSLNLKTKTQDDLICVIEQIMPYFMPSMNLNIRTTNQDDFSESVQFNLDGVSTTIPTDTEMTESIYFEAVFSFVCKLHFYRLPLISDTEKIGTEGVKKITISNLEIVVEVNE